MDRCEYCGEPYRRGVGCTNRECPQRYAFHFRCSCGAPLYERFNGDDPNKRTYFCKECKLYVFTTLKGELENFYCVADGCVYKGKPADHRYIEALSSHSFSCPKCGAAYRIRKVNIAQWLALMERV
jgi:hypothetical protein